MYGGAHQKSFPPFYLVCMAAWRQALRGKRKRLLFCTSVACACCTTLHSYKVSAKPQPNRFNSQRLHLHRRNKLHPLDRPADNVN